MAIGMNELHPTKWSPLGKTLVMDTVEKSPMQDIFLCQEDDRSGEVQSISFMGKNNSLLQMPSPRRSRGVFLTSLIFCLAILYYFDFLGLPFKENGSKLEISPPSKAEVQASTSVKLPQTPLSHGLYSLLTSTNVPQTTSSTLEVKPTSTSAAPEQSPKVPVSPPDVLLIFKTGASTIWRRMPLHLITTLSINQIPNSVIYSDLPEQLSSSVSSIDVLSNVTDIIKQFDPAAYTSYVDQQSPTHINTYREHARLPGDEPPDTTAGNQPGWLLDKYKFLPMLAHAQRSWPDLKWYIYIEDDTFIFWNNILQYVSTLESDNEPSYYGAYSGDGNETFAQGGSGLVFSRSLMRVIFGGDDVPNLEKYGNETSQACCGDVMLGKVLRDYGVYVNRRTYGTGSFRPEPHWKTGFDDLIWCTPVFTFHHLHQRDILQLSELERKQDAGRPVIFRDIFTELILPYLDETMLTHWDNFASRYVLTNNTSGIFHEDLRSVNVTILEAAASSPETCQDACLAVPTCLSWRHESAHMTCRLDKVVKLGRELDPQPHWEPKTVITSGWPLKRIDELLVKEKCLVVNDP